MSKQPTKPQPKQSPPSAPKNIPLKKDSPSPRAPSWGGNPPIKK